ncbi:MAG TPA: hypothetical protein VNI02_01350 [Blastocatellia bacterium]|jgi:hypothetical protein|nr:hypothetical protein [Blastocatellia bacterium]
MLSLKSLTRPANHLIAHANIVRGFAFALALTIAAHSAGCGGKPFNVREKPFHVKEGANIPPPAFSARAEVGAVTIQAEAVTDENLLYDTFDANLILAGLLPVGLMITNSGPGPLDLKKARFEIRPQGARSFKAIDAKRAFKRLISYYEISTYSKSGYKKSQEDFLSYSLDVTRPLAPGESREGMIFFPVPAEAAQITGVTLIASGLDGKQSGSPEVELKLR